MGHYLNNWRQKRQIFAPVLTPIFRYPRLRQKGQYFNFPKVCKFAWSGFGFCTPQWWYLAKKTLCILICNLKSRNVIWRLDYYGKRILCITDVFFIFWRNSSLTYRISLNNLASRNIGIERKFFKDTGFWRLWFFRKFRRIYKRKRQSMSFLRKSIIHFDSDNRHAFNIRLHTNVGLLESCWIRDSNAENRRSKG